MKKLAFLITLCFTATIHHSCIGEDIVDDEIDERVVIADLPAQNILTANQTHQLNFRFFDNVGDEIETVNNIVWSSSNETVATISNTGLVTAISPGTSTITAEVREDNTTIAESSIEFTIESETEMPTQEGTPTEETPTSPELRSGSGSLTGANNYRADGNFTITELANGDLELSFDNNFRLVDFLPGPYVYLTNNPNSVRGALEISRVTVFSGANSYIIENANIDDYAYVLFWCVPFSQAIGQGIINN